MDLTLLKSRFLLECAGDLGALECAYHLLESMEVQELLKKVDDIHYTLRPNPVSVQRSILTAPVKAILHRRWRTRRVCSEELEQRRRVDSLAAEKKKRKKENQL